MGPLLRALLVVAFFHAFVFADVNEGLRAYKNRDYAAAARHFTADAEKGNREARFWIGVLYMNGLGVPKNCSAAMTWFLKSADQAYVPAQSLLADLYESGKCAEKDEQAAGKWLRKAAEGGNADDQYELACKLFSSPGSDASELLDWFRRAAEQGHLGAQSALGVLLDIPHSKKFKEQPEEAAKWRRMAAVQGDPDAQYSLGKMYRDGNGVPQSYQEALKWFRLSAESNDDSGQWGLAEMYRDGLGVPQDYIQAYMWFNLGASHGLEEFNSVAGGAESAEEIRLWRISVRDELALKMTPAQIERAQQLASNWRPAKRTGPPEQERTGTGFQITADGSFLPNYHVVEGCSSIYASLSGKREKVSVTASDAANDLAVIGRAHLATSPLAFSRKGTVSLGQDIVVVGYPLHGLLAQSLNVTGGRVSALAGIQNDVRMIQITAPVQQGNSGGPLLDNSGNVVGIVSSKLNSLKAAQFLGDLTQNINFAIKSTVVRSFLDLTGVTYLTRQSDTALRKSQIADRVKDSVVLVECWK